MKLNVIKENKMTKGLKCWFPEQASVFASIKGDCATFIETGTCGGQGTKAAEMAGYKTIHTIEIHEIQYNSTVKSFQDADEPILDCDINFYLGDSRFVLPEILKTINEKCVFFIDAHDHIYGVAAYEELAIIKNHFIKNHTILIDDIPLYFGDGTQLKKVLLDINPDYKFKFLDCEVRKREPLPGLSGIAIRMVAYIE